MHDRSLPNASSTLVSGPDGAGKAPPQDRCRCNVKHVQVIICWRPCWGGADVDDSSDTHLPHDVRCVPNQADDRWFLTADDDGNVAARTQTLTVVGPCLEAVSWQRGSTHVATNELLKRVSQGDDQRAYEAVNVSLPGGR